jgi:hydrogenase maturation protease
MNIAVGSPTTVSGLPRVLVLGYGNPGRQDDGLGPAAAASIGSLQLPNLKTQDNYQLNIEDAIDVAQHDIVWFIDASKTGSLPYTIKDISAISTIEFTSHFVRPEFILAIAQHYFGKLPQAHLLAIRGYEFEFVEELTDAARDNLRAALVMLTDKIHHVLTGRAS